MQVPVYQANDRYVISSVSCNDEMKTDQRFSDFMHVIKTSAPNTHGKKKVRSGLLHMRQYLLVRLKLNI